MVHEPDVTPTPDDDGSFIPEPVGPALPEKVEGQGVDADVIDVSEERQPPEFQLTSYSGPAPPAELMREYEAIQPGFAQRLLVQFEQNSESNRELKLKTLDLQREAVMAQMNFNRRGQIFGFIAVLCLIIVGGTVALTGENAWLRGGGLATAVSGLATIVLAFLGQSPATEKKSSSKPKAEHTA